MKWKNLKKEENEKKEKKRNKIIPQRIITDHHSLLYRYFHVGVSCKRLMDGKRRKTPSNIYFFFSFNHAKQTISYRYDGRKYHELCESAAAASVATRFFLLPPKYSRSINIISKRFKTTKNNIGKEKFKISAIDFSTASSSTFRKYLRMQVTPALNTLRPP